VLAPGRWCRTERAVWLRLWRLTSHDGLRRAKMAVASPSVTTSAGTS
jgi:hypothetical protein